jgi:hypothetical protein
MSMDRGLAILSGKDGLEGGASRKGKAIFAIGLHSETLQSMYSIFRSFHASATVVLSARYAVKSKGVNLISLSRPKFFCTAACPAIRYCTVSSCGIWRPQTT